MNIFQLLSIPLDKLLLLLIVYFDIISADALQSNLSQRQRCE